MLYTPTLQQVKPKLEQVIQLKKKYLKRFRIRFVFQHPNQPKSGPSVMKFRYAIYKLWENSFVKTAYEKLFASPQS